jgi:hypothetical protein
VTQRVVIGSHDTTFTAACDVCGTTFAGRLDEDIDGGVFLCRFGHPIQIEREEPPQARAAVTAA